MLQSVLKYVLSAAIVVIVSEVAKRSSFFGALIASLPLTSLLAFFWLYYDTRDVGRVAQLSMSIFWLVVPSLTLFLILPILLRRGNSFFLSIGLASLATIICYGAAVYLLNKFKITL